MPDIPPVPRIDSSLVVEPEILVGRRAFPAAQEILSGAPFGEHASLQVAWHDTSVSDEIGSFAVVGATAGLDDLIGEIVQVSFETRSVFAYVLEGASLADGVQLSLCRRTYFAIAAPSRGIITADVVVVQ